MKFRAEHSFEDLSLEAYGELYFDAAFNEGLCREVRLGRDEFEMRREGSRVLRKVRVEVQDRAIPGPVAKVVGTDRFAFVEELEMDLGTGEGSWRTIPTILADRVNSRGTLRFVPDGGSVRRIVEGEVDVSIFGIGSIVERFICADAEKSYADAAAYTRRYLASRR